MTYGWALLLIVIIVGALFALSIFNVGSFTGSRATGFAQVGVTDWNIDPSGYLSLRSRTWPAWIISVTNINGPYGTGNFSFMRQRQHTQRRRIRHDTGGQDHR